MKPAHRSTWLLSRRSMQARSHPRERHRRLTALSSGCCRWSLIGAVLLWFGWQLYGWLWNVCNPEDVETRAAERYEVRPQRREAAPSAQRPATSRPSPRHAAGARAEARGQDARLNLARRWDGRRRAADHRQTGAVEARVVAPLGRRSSPSPPNAFARTTTAPDHSRAR